MPFPRAEIEATLDRYQDLRRRIDAGEEQGWTGIATRLAARFTP